MITKPEPIKETRKQNHTRYQTERMIVENGKCAVCGKPLEKDRLFICRECQKKEDELCENRRYAIPRKY